MGASLITKKENQMYQFKYPERRISHRILEIIRKKYGDKPFELRQANFLYAANVRKRGNSEWGDQFYKHRVFEMLHAAIQLNILKRVSRGVYQFAPPENSPNSPEEGK
jgi:hypothetical protein